MDQADRADGEEGMRARQDGRVYPVGRALRATFDADNHDTLGPALTGLMIDLAKVPFDPSEAVPPLVPPVPAEVGTPPSRTSWSRLAGLLKLRR